MPQFYRSTVNLSAITFTNGDVPAGLQGVAGTAYIVHDSAVALYTATGGNPTNKTALDALAKQTAQDFYDWRSVSFDLVHNGIVNPAPSGLNDVIEWTYTHEEISTRVQSQPWGGEPQEYQHMDPAVGNPNWQKWDRTPGILKGIPGGSGSSSFMGLTTLERGQLWMAYDHSNTLNCGCVTPSCSLCILWKDPCSGALIFGTFTVTQGSTTIGSCHGQGCCVNVPSSGTYNWTFVPDDTTDYSTQSGSKAVTCPGTTTINLGVAPRTGTICFNTLGCPGGACAGNIFLSGTSYCPVGGVTISASGPSPGTCTTNGGGTCCISGLTPGNYTFTGTFSPYFLPATTNTISIVPGCFGFLNLRMLPASGYVCCINCPIPFDSTATWTLTDSRYGPVSLTYGPSPNPGMAGASTWHGTNSGAYPGNVIPGCGGANCPAGPVTLYYDYFCGSLQVGFACFASTSCPGTGAARQITNLGTALIGSPSCPPAVSDSFTLPTTTGTCAGVGSGYNMPWFTGDTATVVS